MPRIKFGIQGAGIENDGGGFYEGPPPVPGTYAFKLKRLTLVKTQGGPKAKSPAGTPMLNVLVEITGPPGNKFIGAGIFRNLVITESTASFVNQFLNALTDGSAAKIKQIQTAFWNDGPYVNKEGHVLKIGNLNVNSPEGELTLMAVVKKKRITAEYPEPGAEIARFLVSKRLSSDEEDAEADLRDDDDPLDDAVDLEADTDEDGLDDEASDGESDDETESWAVDEGDDADDDSDTAGISAPF